MSDQNELKETIETARTKGMDDASIKNLLVKAGWDADIVDAALQGIFVPAPSASVVTAEARAKPAGGAGHGPHLSALEAAVHHVLLWFFTISLSITIAVVSATLFGNETSITAVSSFLATTVITLLPYGFFYLRYLRQLRLQPEFTTGRVWSIITIVLHSLIAMGGLITLVSVAINSPEDGLPVYVAATMITILNLIVVTVYAHATFVAASSHRRLLILRLFPVIPVVLLAVFMVASIVKVGPLRTDEQVRRDLVAASKVVHDYVDEHETLPLDGQALQLPVGIGYERQSALRYQLCATFQTKGEKSSYDYTPPDGSVGTYNFMNKGSGRQCFTLESQQLVEKQNQQNQLPSPVTIKGGL